ncbi:MAG: DUF4197 domain-containing protein [Bacteroidia bacterium]
MKKLLIPALTLTLALGACKTQLLQEAINAAGQLNTQTLPWKPSAEEASQGLKEALLQGVSLSTKGLAGPGPGSFLQSSYKIFMPAELQELEAKVRGSKVLNPLIGPSIDSVILAMNLGAQNAMQKALPLFSNSVKNMSFADALGILTGGQGAATRYFQENLEGELQTAFYPDVQAALDGVRLGQHWNKAANLINKNQRLLGLSQPVEADLNRYVTQQATTALFAEVRKAEDQIRLDPVARTTDMMKKVFEYASQNSTP